MPSKNTKILFGLVSFFLVLVIWGVSKSGTNNSDDKVQAKPVLKSEQEKCIESVINEEIKIGAQKLESIKKGKIFDTVGEVILKRRLEEKFCLAHARCLYDASSKEADMWMSINFENCLDENAKDRLKDDILSESRDY